ncbi:MAG: hypothetical protein ACPHY8_04525 [Patescibacteria group bacterium]
MERNDTSEMTTNEFIAKFVSVSYNCKNIEDLMLVPSTETILREKRFLNANYKIANKDMKKEEFYINTYARSNKF